MPPDDLYAYLWRANAVAWALNGAVTAVIFWWLHGLQRSPYLRYWAWGWCAFLVAQLTGTLFAHAVPAAEIPHLVRALLSGASLAGYYLHAGLLVLGTMLMAGRSPLPPRRLRLVLLALVGLGLGLALASMGGSVLTRLLWRVGVRSALTGLAFLVTGALMFRGLPRPVRPGRLLTAASFLAYGVLLVQYSFFFLLDDPRQAPNNLVRSLGAIDTMVQCFLSLGMITWALERQHDLVQSRTAELAQKSRELLQAQKLEAIGRLAGGVAHDFNNLLTAIIGSCEEVQRDPQVPPASQQVLGELRQAADQAAKMSGQLLLIARNRSGAPVVTDIRQPLLAFAALLRRLIGENIRLEVVTGNEPCRIAVAPGQLEQIVLNLVVNARDAMGEHGTVRVVTSLATQPSGRRVVLSVADEGSGMSEEVQRHLFEPFFTTKAHGTGIGMASVRGIVEQGGGSIAVDSAPGRGTRVVITWPEASGPAVAATAVAPVATDRSVRTVLLAEDDRLVRTVTERALVGAGYQVLVAADGPSALALAEQHPGCIDLLFTDVLMMGMSGPNLAMRVRELRPGIRVLYMSGFVDADSQRLMGIDQPLLLKPFTRDELLAFLQAQIGPAEPS